MVVCVTGHRPDKLYGYDIMDIRYLLLMIKMKEFLKSVKCTEAITGMALGTDIIFALAVLELKKEGYDIKLTCAIPCLNHKAKWQSSKWTEKYDEIVRMADNVVTVCNRPYDYAVMQARNEWMVDRTDEVLAVFDGSSGGTKNCVDYALDKQRPVTIIDPSEILVD